LNKNAKNGIKVLDVVLYHLKNSILFTDERFKPEGGIFIKPKPNNIRVDVIEINLLFAKIYEEAIEGLININTQHEDIERIDQLATIIIDVIDLAYINGYLFKFQQERNYRISRTLTMNNIRVNFTLPTKYYDINTGLTKII